MPAVYAIGERTITFGNFSSEIISNFVTKCHDNEQTDLQLFCFLDLIIKYLYL